MKNLLEWQELKAETTLASGGRYPVLFTNGNQGYIVADKNGKLDSPCVSHYFNLDAIPFPDSYSKLKDQLALREKAKTEFDIWFSEQKKNNIFTNSDTNNLWEVWQKTRGINVEFLRKEKAKRKNFSIVKESTDSEYKYGG